MISPRVSRNYFFLKRTETGLRATHPAHNDDPDQLRIHFEVFRNSTAHTGNLLFFPDSVESLHPFYFPSALKDNEIGGERGIGSIPGISRFLQRRGFSWNFSCLEKNVIRLF
jgi:hypothetical protein